MEFKDWILELKRQMYESGCHYEAIGMVDDDIEWWEDKYNEPLTPREALKEAVEDSMDCN